jgi:hypothetical protein
MHYFKRRSSLSVSELHGNIVPLLREFVCLRTLGYEVWWLEIFTFQTVKAGLHEHQQ